MKFYTYVSRSKVEMLASQLGEPDSRKTKAELTIDAKLLKGSLGSESVHSENVYERLSSVCSYLRRGTPIGGLGRGTPLSSPWIEGTIGASWLVERGEGLVAWDSGVYDLNPAQRRVVLVGSEHHVLGAGPPEAEGVEIRSRRYKSMIPLGNMDTRVPSRRLKTASEEGASVDEFRSRVDEFLSTIDFRYAQYNHVEFLARSLACWDDLVVASPLYVADAISPSGSW